MIIKDIMASPVITVNKEDSVIDVAQILNKNEIHAVPVLEGKIPIGIVTESDFFTKGSVNIYLPSYIEMIKNGGMMSKVTSQEKESMEKLLEAKTKDIMSFPCITINQNAEVEEFMSMIREKSLSSIPVVDDGGNLVGIITLCDIIHLIKVS